MMRSELRNVGLATRLCQLMKILDHIVPESEIGGASAQHTSASALEHIARNEIAQAIRLLAAAVKDNPLWLRGYLLLATIYQHAKSAQQAIATLEGGIDVCKAGLRYLAMESGMWMIRRTTGYSRQARILRRAELLGRYDRILRHQLVLLLVETGRFDEALQYWTEREKAHCA